MSRRLVPFLLAPLLLAPFLLAALGLAVALPAAPAVASGVPGAVLHVSPSGSDSAPGTAAAPLRTIQAGLDRARPGTTILLAPGVYRGRVHTVRGGTADAPITVAGPETGTDVARRHRATLYGTGRVVSIDHDHVVLRGFTVDGQEALAGLTWPTRVEQMGAFRARIRGRTADGRLVYVGAADSTRGVTGVVLEDMYLVGGGGECVRMRNGARGNTISRSVIRFCGLHDKGGTDGHHNGEGVYLGTSPRSTSQPMAAADPTSFNVVRGSIIATFGSECVDVKENAHDNRVEDVVCTDNAESLGDQGSGIELRGHRNVVRGTVVARSAGWGVKIQSDAPAYDKGGNSLVGNSLSGSAGAAVRLGSLRPQGLWCGNRVAGRAFDAAWVVPPSLALAFGARCAGPAR